jgi:hypothetical protein
MSRASNIRKIATVALLSSLSVNVKANELNLQINASAYHWNRGAVQQDKLNEINTGLGVEADWGQGKTMGGFYRNSFQRNSFYATQSYLPLLLGNARAGLTVGGVTGYLLPITPAIGLAATYQYQRYGINFTFVPDVKIRNQPFFGFAALQFTIGLGSF